jgi:flagellar protein FliJ
MKARETAMRLKRRELDDKTRKVEDLERIIREFDTMTLDLERQIQLEEDRTGIRDRGHFSYSTFAKAAAQRRDNLRTSTDGLREQLTSAVKERDDSAEALARASAQADQRVEGRGGRRRERAGSAALR